MSDPPSLTGASTAMAASLSSAKRLMSVEILDLISARLILWKGCHVPHISIRTVFTGKRLR